MERWLNWYATVVADDFCKDEAERGRHCDHDVGHIFSAFTAEAVRFMKRPGAERDNTFHGQIARFAERIAPFAGHFSQKPPLAAVLEPNAVFDFWEGDVDENVRVYAQQALARHSTVYLDIPDRTYMLRDDVFQIRALFIWQCTEGNRFCAILTRPGSNRGWRIAWLEGHHARNIRDSAFDDVWAMTSLDISDRYRPINFNKIDYTQLAQVEKLAWASLACWQDFVDARGVLGGEVPQMDLDIREQPLDIDSEPPLMEERFSLFKMVRIRDVNPARIRLIHERVSATGHTKCRHEVREFWRLQACGKGRKEWRWTKVAGHMRGRGTPKTPMHVIRSPAVI